MKRELRIEHARAKVGWVYPELSWLSEAEAAAANEQRNRLLEELSGWATSSFKGTKLHHGALSQGCLICGNGGWDCLYVNRLCTRNCFYCLEDRTLAGESLPVSEGILMKTTEDHIRYIRAFNIRGIAFSGGEPLLVRERLLEDIRAIRREFGESVYVWLYTNGDLADREALKVLHEAGLDEIRFDLSAREYDLEPVALAKEFIPVVTVEIPAIPEDSQLLNGMLSRMEAIGVNHLNLHQLVAGAFNYRAFSRRGYHFLHQANISVFESEIAALGLLRYARQKGIHLPINYCCAEYKNRFQRLDHRVRMGNVSLRGFEELTDAGCIRTLRVADRDDSIRRMLARFCADSHDPGMWEANAHETEVVLHSSLLSYVDCSTADVTLRYFEPGFRLSKPDAGLVAGNLSPNHRFVHEHSFRSRLSLNCWHRLYVLKEDRGRVLNSLVREYPREGKDVIRNLAEEMRNLRGLSEWEELESGLPEIC